MGLLEDFNDAVLHTDIRRPIRGVMRDLESKGWKPRIVSTFRTVPEQAKKYEDRVSNAFFEYHNVTVDGIPQSLAVDIIDRRLAWEKKGEPAATTAQREKFWRDLRDAAVARGLESGYNWSKPDKAHVNAGGKWARDLMEGSRRAHVDEIARMQNQSWRRWKSLDPWTQKTMLDGWSQFKKTGELNLRLKPLTTTDKVPSAKYSLGDINLQLNSGLMDDINSRREGFQIHRSYPIDYDFHLPRSNIRHVYDFHIPRSKPSNNGFHIR